MPDIITNTKRMLAHSFMGASDNDLIRIAAQAVVYSGEICPDHQDSDDRMVLANIIRDIRFSEAIDCRIPGSTFHFDYDGMTFEIMDEDSYQSRVYDAKQSIVEDARWDVERATEDLCYGSYIILDEDRFMRDLEYDEEALVSHYDGVVHEMYWYEYGAGHTCCGYANDASPDTVIRRGTLYMIRED